jgi:hypothetical protein
MAGYEQIMDTREMKRDRSSGDSSLRYTRPQRATDGGHDSRFGSYRQYGSAGGGRWREIASKVASVETLSIQLA